MNNHHMKAIMRRPFSRKPQIVHPYLSYFQLSLYFNEYNTAKLTTAPPISILGICRFLDRDRNSAARYAQIHLDIKCTPQVLWNFWIENSFGNLFCWAKCSTWSLTFDEAGNQRLRSTSEYILATMSINVFAPFSIASKIDNSLLLRFLHEKEKIKCKSVSCNSPKHYCSVS